MHRLELVTRSPAATLSVGCRLGQQLVSSAVIALVGELGSGKTLFTKGLARGLGVREYRRVSSPTFVIMQEYVGRVLIHHYDAYRLQGADDLLAIGFDEDLSRDRLVVVMEWADRVSSVIPEGTLHVQLQHVPEVEVPEAAPSSGNPDKSVIGRDGGEWVAGETRRLVLTGETELWKTVLESLGERGRQQVDSAGRRNRQEHLKF